MGSRRVAVIKQMQKFDGAFSWAAKIQFNFLYDCRAIFLALSRTLGARLDQI